MVSSYADKLFFYIHTLLKSKGFQLQIQKLINILMVQINGKQKHIKKLKLNYINILKSKIDMIHYKLQKT